MFVCGRILFRLNMLILTRWLISIFILFTAEAQLLGKEQQSAEDIDVQRTLKRLEDLLNYHNHSPLPSPEPPPFDFESYFKQWYKKEDNTTPSNPVLSSREPLLKEQVFLADPESWIPNWNDIFIFPSIDAKVKACKKFAHTDRVKFFNDVIHYLSQGTPEQALIIAQVLPYLKQELENVLLEEFSNPQRSHLERRAIAFALGRIQSAQSASLLWNEIQTTNSEDMIYTCVQALTNFPRTISLDQWTQLLQSPYIHVALFSAEVILEWGTAQSEEIIRRALTGEMKVFPRVLETILNRLSQYPIDKLIPLLIEVMKTNPSLTFQASSILKNRTGMNFGPSPQLWEQWWKNQQSQPQESTSMTPNPLSQPTPQANPNLPRDNVR